MQTAFARNSATLMDARPYSLHQRAVLLCGPSFPAHLSAWREALEEHRHAGSVPATYLAAMRRVVADETAAGALNEDDAVAAAVAIAELGDAEAQRAARALLQDLAAGGNPHAEILRLALCLSAPSRAAFAQARVDLFAILHTGSANARTTVMCLLGETHLAHSGAPVEEGLAYRLFMAAAEAECPAAAAAHFHLGNWYAQQGTEAGFLLARHHFERGSELGCAHCLRGLGEIHQGRDVFYAQELLELADLTEGGLPPSGVGAGCL